MPRPISEVKAELFRALANPARIRVLEVLSDGEFSVGEIQSQIGIESSHLSQQLGVLRRAGLVGRLAASTSPVRETAAAARPAGGCRPGREDLGRHQRVEPAGRLSRRHAGLRSLFDLRATLNRRRQ